MTTTMISGDGRYSARLSHGTPVVTDDEGGELRWRYRFVPGPMPFKYEKIDLEPGQAASIPQILRGIADSIETGIKEWFGSKKEADKTTEVFHSKVKGDALSEKIKKLGSVW